MGYYAVCNAGGPISVKLDAATKAEALAAFAALDGRAAIDATIEAVWPELPESVRAEIGERP